MGAVREQMSFQRAKRIKGSLQDEPLEHGGRLPK
jgi:hypothetical protein